MSCLPKLHGQEKAVGLLKSSLERNTLAHAYLFSGPEGVGKKALAIQLAQSVNCLSGSMFSSCACLSCQKIAQDIHPDVNWLGKDEKARSIKIADIRALQSWIMLRPLEGRRKVCIINGVERLTEEAANAFLKTLEEPPNGAHIVLLGEHLFRLPTTILSRVIEIVLPPLPYAKVCALLQNEYGITENVAFLAHQSRGSIGRAVRYHEENYCVKKNEVIDRLLGAEVCEFFLGMVSVASADMDDMLHMVSSFFHDVLLLKNGVAVSFFINQDRVQDIQTWSRQISLDGLVDLLTACEDARQALKRNAGAKLVATWLAGKAEQVHV